MKSQILFSGEKKKKKKYHAEYAQRVVKVNVLGIQNFYNRNDIYTFAYKYDTFIKFAFLLCLKIVKVRYL